jgi:hypothetical protein
MSTAFNILFTCSRLGPKPKNNRNLSTIFLLKLSIEDYNNQAHAMFIKRESILNLKGDDVANINT